MSRARVQVRSIAREAEIDADEALLILWDAGFEQLVSPGDYVPRSSLSRARRSLGLHPSGVARDAPIEPPDLPPPPSERLEPRLASRGESDVEERFQWHIVGRGEPVAYLGSDDVVAVHDALTEYFRRSHDPISPPGIRDRNLLDSALFRPHTSLGDVGKYPTITMAAAALFHSLVLNHAFHNGNKRTALVSLFVYLERNERFLDATEIEVFRYVLQVARHRLVPEGTDHADREVLAIAEWLEPRICEVRGGERLLHFNELRRILNSYHCEVKVLSGNRALITRPLEKRRWFRKGPDVAQSHIWYGGEGREVKRNTLHKLRQDLWLDEDHGVDSSRFYAARPGIDEFISMFRKTLQHLARM